MSDEEYARLLGLVRGAQGGEHRFPPGAYEPERMVAAAPSAAPAAAAAVTNASLSSVVKTKATSLEGESATDRMRLGTLRLPESLLERIRLVLKGTFRHYFAPLPFFFVFHSSLACLMVKSLRQLTPKLHTLPLATLAFIATELLQHAANTTPPASLSLYQHLSLAHVLNDTTWLGFDLQSSF